MQRQTRSDEFSQSVFSHHLFTGELFTDIINVNLIRNTPWCRLPQHVLTFNIRALKQRRRGRQQERQKSNRFRFAKQQLCTCITLYCTLLCRRCTTTTWDCLISRFVEDLNTRQRLSFPFSEFWYTLLEFNSRKNSPTFHELNEMEYALLSLKHHEFTFKWRFCSRRCCCCLSSLL